MFKTDAEYVSYLKSIGWDDDDVVRILNERGETRKKMRETMGKQERDVTCTNFVNAIKRTERDVSNFLIKGRK